MWLPTCSPVLAAGSVLSHGSKLQWAQAWHTTGRGSRSFLTIFQLSAAGLSAAGFAGAVSHGTSSKRLPTVISTATVNAMPLAKVRTWDQSTTSCEGKGEPAVSAASREYLCHSCWTYTSIWYHSAINKNLSFIIWFTFKKSVWIRHYFYWLPLQHPGLQSKPKMSLEEEHKDGVSPGQLKPQQLKTPFYFLFCLGNSIM